MIDLHTHILPGLDHGARDWEEALKMCRIAADDGITVLAATPHVSDAFPNSREDIAEAAWELGRRVKEAGIDLEVVVGGDYHIHPDLAPDNVLTLDDNGQYFLLEFPYQVLPPNSDAFIARLVWKGLTPIVTHPERISTLHGQEEKLRPLVEKGALVQVTAGSLTGEFGPECAKSARVMLKKGLVHFIASDAHWADERPPVLSAGLKAASEIIGEEAARKLVLDNPRFVLEGREVA
jgi:protein-tyrosine phosphatase